MLNAWHARACGFSLFALNYVLAYKEKQKEITEQNLAFLAQQAQELNLGY